jgi:hypothetical protein
MADTADVKPTCAPHPATSRNVRRVTFYIGTDGRILDNDAPIPDGHGEGVAERLAAPGIPRRWHETADVGVLL